MTRRGCALGLLVIGLTWGGSTPGLYAAKPWETLIPFKRVEATPNKDYVLTEDQGPWMIMATSFAGPGAEKQAHDLVLELRKNLKLPAYTHRQTYDFTQPVEGLGLNRYGESKKMRYANRAKFDEIAVLVGDFPSVEDPQAEKALQKIKHLRPDCLDFKKNKNTTQRFVGLREWQKRLTKDPEKKQLGPMGAAFVTRNPLLPKEYFAPGGLDPLVEEMNRHVAHSLLDNPKRYSVRVATFRGSSTMKLAEIERQGKNLPSKLEEAALKANELTIALRKQGVEAYEFHDRYESIVTVGAFDEIGKPGRDGQTELHPAVLRLMQQYGPQKQQLPGQGAVGLVPRSLEGICFDVQPVPVEVPRSSVAATIAAGKRLDR